MVCSEGIILSDMADRDGDAVGGFRALPIAPLRLFLLLLAVLTHDAFCRIRLLSYVTTRCMHRQGAAEAIIVEQPRQSESLPLALLPSANFFQTLQTRRRSLHTSSQPTGRHHPAHEAYSVSMPKRPVSRPGRQTRLVCVCDARLCNRQAG